jgi:hypothetical protein
MVSQSFREFNQMVGTVDIPEVHIDRACSELGLPGRSELMDRFRGTVWVLSHYNKVEEPDFPEGGAVDVPDGGVAKIIKYEQSTRTLTILLSGESSTQWVGASLTVPRPSSSGWWLTHLIFEQAQLDAGRESGKAGGIDEALNGCRGRAREAQLERVES